MEVFDTSKSILQTIQTPELNARNIQLLVKRDDLIHTEVSGNKWRKLKYHVQHFYSSRKTHILTFGGAYSNHLLATASSCNSLNIPSIGIVRGDELNPQSNHVLARCEALGMQLHFVSRDEYTLRDMSEYHEELIQEYPNAYIIPEGGATYYGMIGCQELIKELPPFNHIFVAQGTTTTSCGLALGGEFYKTHVVPVLKGFDSLNEMSKIYLKSGFSDDLIKGILEGIVVHSDYDFGGYGKFTDELIQFIENCDKNLQLPLDKVYTGKAFYCLMQEIQKKEYENQTIVFLHTGGLVAGAI